MFVRNKYRSWYLKIINNARKQDRKKGEGIYYEAHHILPKSICPQYRKNRRNLILLTAREHFLVHRLLVKFTVGHAFRSMSTSLWFITNNTSERSFTTSKWYQQIKEQHAQNLSEKMMGTTLLPSRILSQSKQWEFYNPLGVKIKIVNLNEFCRKNNLSQGGMRSMCIGELRQYRGYTLTGTAPEIKSKAHHFKIRKPDGDIVEGYNIKQFSMQNGLDNSSIGKVIKGKLESYKGWTRV